MTQPTVLHITADGPPSITGYVQRTLHLARTQQRLGLAQPILVELQSKSPLDQPRCQEMTHGELRGYIISTTVGKISRRAPKKPRPAPFPSCDTPSVSPAKQTVVKAYFSWLKQQGRLLKESLQRKQFRRQLENICRQENPDILHAHCPYYVGLAALDVGRRLEIPVLYEVRGFWEESGVVSGDFSRQSSFYQHSYQREKECLTQADAIICLCEGLRHEAISRGADAEKIFLCRNGIDQEWAAKQHLPRVDHRRQFPWKYTIGYVGSLRSLEGVETLPPLVAELRKRNLDVGGVVVGDGPSRCVLEQSARQLGIASYFLTVGSVPPAHVGPWYDALDILLISRPNNPVTRMVTPLKPLEAMARGVVVLASDLPALRELIQADQTGVFYPPDNFPALVDKCLALVLDEPWRQQIALRAQATMQNQWTWHHTIQGQQQAYEFLLGTNISTIPTPSRKSA